MLVGIPGSGKSYYADNILKEKVSNAAYISTDKLVEEFAKSNNQTYNEVFDEYMPTAVSLMTDEVIDARESGLDIIWDQTSTTVASRARKLRMLREYKAIAIVVPTPNDDELTKRLQSRIGKHISQRVIMQMKDGFVPPSYIEGFDEIWELK
jgi:adenylate kinase family enzyme